MTAPDARQRDELREALVDIARAMNPLLHEPLMTKIAEEWVDEHLLPVITAWHEKAAESLARERAAEELRAAATDVRYGVVADPASYLDARADMNAAFALTADDQPVQP